MKPVTTSVNHWKKFKQLDRSVKMFITITIFFGLFQSVRSLFFNFYILSLGFNKDFLGIANSMVPAATLILGLLLGVLTDRIGRKNAAIIGLLLQALGYTAMLMSKSGSLILVSLFIAGIGEALFLISRLPLLTRLTSQQNRNYVFSLNMALSTLAGVVGSSLGGQLPGWFETLFDFAPETPSSYQGILFAGLTLTLLALIPAILIEPGSKSQRLASTYKRKIDFNIKLIIQNIMHNPVMWKMVSSNLFIGLGAALMVPYFNLFFVETFGINKQVLGAIFSAASLFMGISMLASPWLARKLGSRIRAIVAAQGISLIFLLVNGFSPWFSLALVGFFGRGALMNMASPINQAFAMDIVDENEQGTLTSLLMLSWQTGWTLMPLVSGLIQERYDFTPIFIATGLLYAIGIGMKWVFFKDVPDGQQTVPQTG
jgi:MFS family permease